MRQCLRTSLVASAAGVILTCVLAVQGDAQGTRVPVPTPNQTAYFEFGGNAGFVSGNLDRKLNDVFSLRVGTGWWYRPGTFSFSSEETRRSQRAVLRPVTLNFSPRLLPGSAHRFEMGAGVIFARRSDLPEPERQARALTGLLGYRWTPPTGIVRLGAYYNHALSGPFPWSGVRPGASFGMSF
jgi:hypothetical protein